MEALAVDDARQPSASTRSFRAWPGPLGAGSGPSRLTLVGVLVLTLMGSGILGLGIVRLRDSGKRARAAEVLRALSKTTEDILAQVHSDIGSAPVSGVEVAEKNGLRFPADEVPYRNLTLRLNASGASAPAHRVLYAFVCVGNEVGDGYDNDRDGIVDEGYLLRWDELKGPRIIGRNLTDVTFTRRGTTLEVALNAATPRPDAPPLIRRNSARFDLMTP
ncbi:MAG: hypothetical protein U1E76_09095 [Planctomycetota bacterium]